MFPSLLPAVVRHLVYPFYRGFRKDMVLSILKDLEDNQWFSKEQIEEIQWKKLKRLLKYASIHVPYYRDSFKKRGIEPDEIENLNDFMKIPFLTRNVIAEKSGPLVTRDPLIQGYASSTGGSIGDPLYFYCDLAAGPVRRANTIRQFRYAGIDIGERQLRLWGGRLDRAWKEGVSERAKDYFNNIRFLSSFDMSDEAMNKYASIERFFKPSLIVAYPSALALLSDFCKRRALRLHKPKAIITSGETLYPEQREIIEEVFSAPVFNRYGSRQFSNIASECKQHNGLHITSDLFFVEVIDKSGRPAKSGEWGELVVTDLSNYYMPFIRYKTGDFAVPTDRVCGCGRGLPLLDKIEGRSFDTIRTPEGKSVGGFFWTRLSRTVPGITRFQIEQKGLNRINFRIVPGSEWKDEFKSVLEEKIKSNCGENFNVTFLVVDDISLAPSGKSRFIISDTEERLVIKSKIHKANITAVKPDLNDCLRIDEELMELADIAEYEKILVVDATNGARLETFAVRGPGGKGEIIACGTIAAQLSAGDEIGVMAFTWSMERESCFSNILVDKENKFVRYLTEIAGEKL